MPSIDLELNPVDHITADAIGQPGKRIFYLQAWQGERTVTLILEKLQLQTMAVGTEQFLAEIQEKFPHLPEARSEYNEEKMHIHPPVDPLFRIGEIGMGYDADQDMIVLVLREVVMEGADTDQAGVVRVWCTRSQVRALARWSIELASRGRPICPQCGQPMEPEGHFCPKKNGHKH
jgi:uncharacterized repeat protein (TIGR03847 family)